MLRRVLKILHEIGSFGMVGTLAACIVLITFAPTQSPVTYAALRQEILALTKWLLVPSLVLVLISGLLAIAANRAYMDAGWAWVKALLGVSMFEGTLLTVVGSARHDAELSTLAVTGQGDPAQLAQVLRTEWGGLWIILTASLANIVLGVCLPASSPASVRPAWARAIRSRRSGALRRRKTFICMSMPPGPAAR